MKISTGVKNILWYQITFILSIGLPIFTLPIFTRYLSLTDYGLISLANIYGILVVGVCNLGLITSFERNFYEAENSTKKITLLWTCIITVLTILILAFFSTYVFQKQISNLLFITVLPQYLLLFSLINLGTKSLIQYFYIEIKLIIQINVFFYFSKYLYYMVLIY